MTRRIELAGDIEDCIGRAKDLGLPDAVTHLLAAKRAVNDSLSQDGRSSVPPPANLDARNKATEAFRNARRLLREVIK